MLYLLYYCNKYCVFKFVRICVDREKIMFFVLNTKIGKQNFQKVLFASYNASLLFFKYF